MKLIYLKMNIVINIFINLLLFILGTILFFKLFRFMIYLFIKEIIILKDTIFILVIITLMIKIKDLYQK